MGRILRWTASVVLLFSIVGASPVQAAPPRTDRQRALAAGRYLVAKQSPNGSFAGFSPVGSTADAVLDLVALGRGAQPLRDAIGFLRRQVRAGNVDSIGLQAKVILAVRAAGGDPRSFGGADLVREITDTYRPSGRFGTAVVLDQALAILALRATGAPMNVQAATWLAGAQCPDGGWQYDRPYRAGENRHCLDTSTNDVYGSDSNTTAYAIMALEGLATPAKDPFAFLTKLRDRSAGPANGGWGFTWGFRTTDANSTALVLQAYAASGTPVPGGAGQALARLQYRCGSVAYSWKAGARTGQDLGATIGAILGFLRTPLPVSGSVTGTFAGASSCPA
ncbi:MAG TPA: prenyltransferase/squalene oxidase repeat-containing protein [Actinomycetota bacterium]|nr:prenyltransferase/squalene oxidase repeat-containing protein [Actinomycetota bacterium]